MIKIVVLDVDGTLTDGQIYMGETGELMKAFYTHDCIGVRNLVENGIVPIIITGRDSQIIYNRAKEMYIEEVYTNVMNKKKLLNDILKDKKINFSEVAYIGDDTNDLDAMEICGLIACPNDAVKEVKDVATFISKYNGGRGAVRELCDYVLNMEE